MMTFEKLLNALDQCNDGMAIIGDDRILSYINKSYCTLFGYDKTSDLIGKSWGANFIDSYFKRMNNEIFPMVFQSGYWAGEVIVRKSDGSQIILYLSLTKIMHEGILCICRDDSRNLNLGSLDFLTQKLGKGIIVEDEFRHILFANTQFCSLFKFQFLLEDLFKYNFLDLIKKVESLVKNVDEFKHTIEIISQKREPFYEEKIYLTDDSILELDFFPIFLKGKFKGQLWTFTDITEEIKIQSSLIDAKNRAVASEKSKTSFLSYMSHEIRTPMNAILGLSEQLSFSKLDDNQTYLVKNIADSAKILLFIINDILDLSKMEAGKMIFHKTTFNLKSVVESVENILRPKAEEKGLLFLIDYDNTINDFHFSDEIRIRQILINIINNAIKFTQKGGIKIVLKNLGLEKNTQIIEFRCTDTGIGIPKSGMSYLFEDFFQADQITNSLKESGSGLGLVITNNIIKLIGGKIEINSTENKGTEVCIQLPLEIKTKNILVNNNLIQINNTILEGKRILVVEDNVLNRMVFKMMLTNLKIVVDEAENGLEALSKIDQNAYDLILMDIQMPVMDGPTTLFNILNSSGVSVPVVAITASAFKSEVHHLRTLGFNDCITKPVDQQTLQKKLVISFSKIQKNAHNEKLVHAKIKKVF